MDAQSDENRYPAWTSSIGPAPRDLRLVQAFVNTRDVEKQADELETMDGLRNWLVLWGLISPDRLVAEPERRQAIEFREGFREMLLANNGDGGDPARLTTLERALGDLPLRCVLREEGTFDLVAVRSGWPQAAARMLTIVTSAMGEGTWNRLKACRRDDCRWAFFDSSKNRSGKWCAMAGCGDLMKARVYRQRLRQRARDSVN